MLFYAGFYYTLSHIQYRVALSVDAAMFNGLVSLLVKGTDVVGNADVNEHRPWPSRKPRVVVSPMHDDVCAVTNNREQLSRSSSTLVKSCDSPDNSAVTSSDDDESVVSRGF